MAKLKVVHKWVGLSHVQSFMLILGRIGLGQLHLGRIEEIGPTATSNSVLHGNKHRNEHSRPKTTPCRLSLTSPDAATAL